MVSHLLKIDWTTSAGSGGRNSRLAVKYAAYRESASSGNPCTHKQTHQWKMGSSRPLLRNWLPTAFDQCPPMPLPPIRIGAVAVTDAATGEISARHSKTVEPGTTVPRLCGTPMSRGKETE